jgi:hypothetical protein
MINRLRWHRLVAAAILLPALLASARSEAGPLPPGLADPASRDADLARIARALETRIVAARLGALGLDAASVQARVARLDDAELHKLAESLPDAGVGGQGDSDWERNAGVVLLLLVAVALVGALIYFTIVSSPF